MESTSAIPNGNEFNQSTPSRLAKKETDNLYTDSQNPKRKGSRNDTNNEKFCEELLEQLANEKKNNQEMKQELSKMREQLSLLATSINKLNDTILNLQKENSDLVKQLSEKKANKKPKNENKSTAKPNKIDATNTSAAQTTPSQSLNTDSINNSIEMLSDVDSNNHTLTQPKVNETTEHTNESSESSDSDDDDNNATKREQQASAHHTTNERVKRSSKIPPIDVWTQNQSATQRMIRNQMPQHSCVFNIINKSKLRIIATSADIRNKLINLLKERKIEFNTYTPSNEKMLNVLLKGTEIDDKNEIEYALEQNGIHAHKINRFITGHMRKTKTQSNIWQIVLLP